MGRDIPPSQSQMFCTPKHAAFRDHFPRKRLQIQASFVGVSTPSPRVLEKPLCQQPGQQGPTLHRAWERVSTQNSEGPCCGIRLSALQSNYLVPLLKLPHLKMGIFKKQYLRHGFSKLNEVPHIKRRALCWAYHQRPTRTWDRCREGGGLQESAGTFICFMPRNLLNFCN